MLKARDLTAVQDRTGKIRPDDVLLFCTFRNEDQRLPYFVQYYRDLGIDHFLMVDNDSDDGGRDFVADQPDVSLWQTKAAYGAARHGIDWLTYLQGKYAHDHWALTVDVDEFFVYPFCDSRPIRALADWLDASKVRSFGALLLDMYPRVRSAPSLTSAATTRSRLPAGSMRAITSCPATPCCATCGYRVARARACFSRTNRDRPPR